jgi:hypothetical protein
MAGYASMEYRQKLYQASDLGLALGAVHLEGVEVANEAPRILPPHLLARAAPALGQPNQV